MSGPGAPAPSVVYLFRGGELLLPPEGSPAPGGQAGPASAGWGPEALGHEGLSGTRVYRGPSGRICGAARFGPEADLDIPGFDSLRSLPFRSALTALSPAESAEAAKGLALLNWLEVARHCGSCGGRLLDDEAEGFENGARKCVDCGRLFFPRVSPAVIVLVRRGGKALLAHNAGFPAGRFGLIAGFVSPGETLEEAARRELREESGVEVASLRYVSSQPWPFPDSLMVAFEADWASGEGVPDGREITELRWCPPDELPSIPPPGSVARALIDSFVASTGGDLTSRRP